MFERRRVGQKLFAGMGGRRAKAFKGQSLRNNLMEDVGGKHSAAEMVKATNERKK